MPSLRRTREESFASGTKGQRWFSALAPREALGKSLHIIIPENLRERHDQGYHQVMKSGQSKYSHELLAVPALKKDGSRISVEFTMTLIQDHQGLILGTAAIIRDVSARWERERATKRRLAELEAQFKQLRGT